MRPFVHKHTSLTQGGRSGNEAHQSPAIAIIASCIVCGENVVGEGKSGVGRGGGGWWSKKCV